MNAHGGRLQPDDEGSRFLSPTARRVLSAGTSHLDNRICIIVNLCLATLLYNSKLASYSCIYLRIFSVSAKNHANEWRHIKKVNKESGLTFLGTLCISTVTWFCTPPFHEHTDTVGYSLRSEQTAGLRTFSVRLESFLRRARRSGLYHTDRPTVAQLAEDADDTLFSSVTHSSNHLLHVLLPEHTNHPDHIRSRTHSFKLSAQHDDRNFIDIMFFRHAYSVCVWPLNWLT